MCWDEYLIRRMLTGEVLLCDLLLRSGGCVFVRRLFVKHLARVCLLFFEGILEKVVVSTEVGPVMYYTLLCSQLGSFEKFLYGKSWWIVIDFEV